MAIAVITIGLLAPFAVIAIAYLAHKRNQTS